MGKLKSILIFSLLFAVQTSFSATQCVGHRGNLEKGLENSSAGIKAALEMGLWGVEFDVHHSIDGQPIIIHDETFRRTALLSDPLDQKIEKCDFDLKVSQLDFKHIKEFCRLSNKEKIPTLEDVFKLFDLHQNSIALLEYKDIPNIQDLFLMKQYFEKRPDKLWVLSFDEAALDYVGRYRATPGFEFLSKIKLIHLRFFGSSGAFHFDGIDVHVFNDTAIDDVRKEEKVIGVWTYDDDSNLVEFFEKEVDFITTNKPSQCLKTKEEFEQIQ